MLLPVYAARDQGHNSKRRYDRGRGEAVRQEVARFFCDHDKPNSRAGSTMPWLVRPVPVFSVSVSEET